jgi:hypothetical protein
MFQHVVQITKSRGEFARQIYADGVTVHVDEGIEYSEAECTLQLSEGVICAGNWDIDRVFVRTRNKASGRLHRQR